MFEVAVKMKSDGLMERVEYLTEEGYVLGGRVE